VFARVDILRPLPLLKRSLRDGAGCLGVRLGGRFEGIGFSRGLLLIPRGTCGCCRRMARALCGRQRYVRPGRIGKERGALRTRG
jgi:hypothetical protein